MAQGWKKDYTRYKSFFLNIVELYRSKPNLRIYLELMLSLGTIIIFSIFAIKPTILTIIELNNEIKSKENTVLLLQQKISNLQQASVLLQNSANRLGLINQAVPVASNIEVLVDQVEKLASLNSVQLNSFSTSEVALKGNFEKKKSANDFKALASDVNELSIAFSVSGNYQDLFNFLTSIESLRRPIKIDSFIFSTSASVESGRMIVLTISGRTPYLGEQL